MHFVLMVVAQYTNYVAQLFISRYHDYGHSQQHGHGLLIAWCLTPGGIRRLYCGLQLTGGTRRNGFLFITAKIIGIAPTSINPTIQLTPHFNEVNSILFLQYASPYISELNKVNWLNAEYCCVTSGQYDSKEEEICEYYPWKIATSE